MRLIDADALEQDVYHIGYKPIIEWKDVQKQSTIEAEEVVRCKDCINFTKGKDEWGSCFENPMKMWRETDFCSWGERRDDELSD